MRGGDECQVILSTVGMPAVPAHLWARMAVPPAARYRSAPKQSIRIGVITSGGAL